MCRKNTHSAKQQPEGAETHRVSPVSRRDFLSWSGTCCAHLMWMSAASSLGARRLFAAESQGRKIVAEEPWGRIEELYEGVWAVVSTPLAKQDWTTLSNGGIIAGKERVLVVESFARPAGAAWVSKQAQALTGRLPTDVVITHYHGDHANGVNGFLRDGDTPRVWTTGRTKELLTQEKPRNDGRGDENQRASLFEDAAEIAMDQTTEIDLGGRKVRIEPRAGHTASDVTVEIEDPSVVFYGDLLWNGMFPNFRDTIPSLFAESIQAAMRTRDTVYVPGHGPLADKDDITRLLAVLAEVERAARKTFGTETTADETGRLFRLPESLGQWALFNDDYFVTAMSAWHRELAAGLRASRAGSR